MKESGDKQPSRKIIQNNDSEDDPGSWENNEKDARNVYQRPTRTKEQTEMNNTLEGIHSRITEAEKWVSGLEDRMVEIIAAKQNIEKKNEKSEDSLRDLWDNIKCTNICIIGVPEGEERENRFEQAFKKIIAENFPSIGKEILSQV